MKINAPCIITPRLLPGLRITGNGGDCFISIEYAFRQCYDGRIRYRYFIDNGKLSHTDDQLKSGCNSGNLQQGLSSLLSFLSAAGEAERYFLSTNRESENLDLFPKWVREFAHQYSDEIQMLQIELDINHNNDVIIEE